MWLTLAVLAVSTWLLWKCLKRIGKRREPPGPWGLPIIGYLPFLDKQRPNLAFAQLATKYGDVFQMRMGSVKMVVVNGQRAIRQLYGKPMDFAGTPDWTTYQIQAEIIDNYLYTPFSLRYWIHKKLLLNTVNRFVAERAQDLEDAVHKVVNMLLNEAKRRNRQPFDPRTLCEQCACTLAFYHTYGRLVNITGQEIEEVQRLRMNVLNAGKAFSKCDLLPWMKWLPTMWKPFTKFKTSVRLYRDYHYKLATASIDQYTDGKSRKCFIDCLCYEAAQLDHDDKSILKVDKDLIAKTSNNLSFFGTLTPLAIPMKWIILLLALHPNVQQTVRDEINQKVGGTRQPGARDAGLLPYTTAVLQEIFRYVSMAALGTVKFTTCDTELDGCFIPKNTAVTINLFSANRDKNVFVNPDTFDPQRFLTPTGTLKEDVFDDVIATGLGPRRCGGRELMWLELYTFFASFVQSCRVEQVPGYSLDPTDYYYEIGVVPSLYKVVLCRV